MGNSDLCPPQACKEEWYDIYIYMTLMYIHMYIYMYMTVLLSVCPRAYPEMLDKSYLKKDKNPTFFFFLT